MMWWSRRGKVRQRRLIKSEPSALMARNIVSKASIEFPLSPRSRDRTDWFFFVGFHEDPGSVMYFMQMWSGDVCFLQKFLTKGFRKCDSICVYQSRNSSAIKESFSMHQVGRKSCGWKLQNNLSEWRKGVETVDNQKWRCRGDERKHLKLVLFIKLEWSDGTATERGKTKGSIANGASTGSIKL